MRLVRAEMPGRYYMPSECFAAPEIPVAHALMRAASRFLSTLALQQRSDQPRVTAVAAGLRYVTANLALAGCPAISGHSATIRPLRR